MAQSAPTYCSLLAQEQGYDPIGTAYPYEDLILIELPLPWAYRIYESAHIPADLAEFVLEKAKAREYKLRVLFIAPEEAYCTPNRLRVMHFRRPDGLAAGFRHAEWSVPTAEMPALVRALCVDPQRVEAWAAYAQDVEGVRDVMVCTHGAVDVVCAKFGYPSYKLLRTQYANEKVRVWRVSHFGGHVCAPTLLTFPDGRAWAYIQAEQAPQLLLHAGEPADLYNNYRGWATLPRPFGQVVEREVWMREGWAWLDCEVDGEVVAAHEPAQEDEKVAWAEVLLHYVRPDGRRGRYWGRVELKRTLDILGSTKGEHTHVAAQYHVVSLKHMPELWSEELIEQRQDVALLQAEGTFA